MWKVGRAGGSRAWESGQKQREKRRDGRKASGEGGEEVGRENREERVGENRSKMVKGRGKATKGGTGWPAFGIERKRQSP